MNNNHVHVTYYAEHTDSPSSWASPRPCFDVEKFNKELEKRCGCIGSVPRFRLRWAGEIDEYIIEDYDILIGYAYREDGVEKFVSCTDKDTEIPSDAITIPISENCKVFTPRFVIEEYREPWYHKAWFVEEVEKTGFESGRHDVLSHYREPSETDIQMCEHLARLRRTLTDEEIAAGMEALQAQEAAEAALRREEFVDDLTEETVRALTDGIPNAPEFNWKPNNMNIKDYSRAVIGAN